jgi:cytochrome c peroxidase
MKKIFYFLILGIILYTCGCKKEGLKNEAATREATLVLPETVYGYKEKHGINSNLATLGRVLFYDKNLSGNNAVSCGSCHKQEFAFADNVKVNKNFDGTFLKRNTPSIQGIKGFSGETPQKDNQATEVLFWDGRQKNLGDMVLNPVLNHNEMNMPSLDLLVKKLSAISYYPDLFRQAFSSGTAEITKENIAFALEAFIGCLNTNGVQTFEGDLGRPLTSQVTTEEEGRFLFHHKYNCAKCHDPGSEFGNTTVSGYGGASASAPNFMFNIGLDEVYADNGVGNLTGRPSDKGVFKVPTLQNISLTAPYMHDGRFTDLGQVIDHYSHGIAKHPNLTMEFLNPDGTPKKLNINAAEKMALISFLNSLKDDDFLTSPMYSDPFVK